MPTYMQVSCLKSSLPISSLDLAWYAEFLLEIGLEILLRKTGARLNFKIALVSLHINPGSSFTKLTCIFDVSFEKSLL
jgi:hypothetical protein